MFNQSQGAVRGFRSYAFDFVSTIVLPSGEAFQVSNDGLPDDDRSQTGPELVMSPDARIVYVFPQKLEEKGRSVLVQLEVLRRLPF